MSDMQAPRVQSPFLGTDVQQELSDTASWAIANGPLPMAHKGWSGLLLHTTGLSWQGMWTRAAETASKGCLDRPRSAAGYIAVASDPKGGSVTTQVVCHPLASVIEPLRTGGLTPAAALGSRRASRAALRDVPSTANPPGLFGICALGSLPTFRSSPEGFLRWSTCRRTGWVADYGHDVNVVRPVLHGQPWPAGRSCSVCGASRPDCEHGVKVRIHRSVFRTAGPARGVC